MMVDLDIAYQPDSQIHRKFGEVEFSQWAFKISEQLDLLVYYRCKGLWILSKGSRSKPFECRLVKNSKDGKAYTEIFTNGYLTADDVWQLITDLRMKYSEARVK